jgi:hypothetical protein
MNENLTTPTTVECDVAIIGGGLGGVAGALSACESGASVVLTEETDWLGGQVTSQLVSALDEHEHIERFGGTRSYSGFRDGVRADYEREYGRKIANPGGGWVSELCFEPRVGLRVIHSLLEPWIASGRLKVFCRCVPCSAAVDSGRIAAVTCTSPNGALTVRADYFLDATELGDLLALAGAPFATGAEAVEDTGEPNASKDGPHPHQVQAFTCCFIVEHVPGRDFTIRKPVNYAAWRDNQPFHLDVPAEAGGQPIHYPVFTPSFPGQLTFWTYRRIFDSGAFQSGRRPHDLALINWDSNDYRGGDLIGASPSQRQRLLGEAKALSASFLYYLQTEVPRDDGQGFGYPGLRLVPEAAGTPDGFAMAPYIREARRLRSLIRVTETDICADPAHPSARAKPFADSVGVGHYPIDVHTCCNGPMPDYRFAPSLPFQIPLGALIGAEISNLIAAAKNIATTHITNGAYRLHPVEWNVGESAGALAAFCLRAHRTPAQVRENTPILREFQKTLLERGIPLAWGLEAGPQDPDFIPMQTCLVRAPFTQGRRAESLSIFPDEPITQGELAALDPVLNQPAGAPLSFRQAARQILR